jgi:hypothetical protein
MLFSVGTFAPQFSRSTKTANLLRGKTFFPVYSAGLSKKPACQVYHAGLLFVTHLMVFALFSSACSASACFFHIPETANDIGGSVMSKMRMKKVLAFYVILW